MHSKNKLTPKQRVLKRYPRATVAWWGSFCVVLYKVGGGPISGYHETKDAAWASAALSLKGKSD